MNSKHLDGNKNSGSVELAKPSLYDYDDDSTDDIVRKSIFLTCVEWILMKLINLLFVSVNVCATGVGMIIAYILVGRQVSFIPLNHPNLGSSELASSGSVELHDGGADISLESHVILATENLIPLQLRSYDIDIYLQDLDTENDASFIDNDLLLTGALDENSEYINPLRSSRIIRRGMNFCGSLRLRTTIRRHTKHYSVIERNCNEYDNIRMVAHVAGFGPMSLLQASVDEGELFFSVFYIAC